MRDGQGRGAGLTRPTAGRIAGCRTLGPGVVLVRVVLGAVYHLASAGPEGTLTGTEQVFRAGPDDLVKQ